MTPKKSVTYLFFKFIPAIVCSFFVCLFVLFCLHTAWMIGHYDVNKVGGKKLFKKCI